MTYSYGKIYPQGGSAVFSATQRLDTRRGDELKPRSTLNGGQKAVSIGDTIPLIFARYVDGIGGVWLSPPASEARFQSDPINNACGASYHLVLCDGQIGTILNTDVYHGDTPVTTGFTQAYNARAGTFTPGNFITQLYKTVNYENTQEVSGPVGENAVATISAQGSYPTRLSVTWEKVVGDGTSYMPGYTFNGFTTLETSEVTETFTEIGSGSRTIAATYRATIQGTDRPPYTKPEAAEFCGTGGSYAGLSTFSLTKYYPDGDGRWNRQVHLFIRAGLSTTRLLDGITGATSNFADVTNYLLRINDQVPSALINTELLSIAAAFTNAQGLFFNGIIASATNLRDFLRRTAPNFLLRITQRNGLWGLAPVLPFNNAYEIYTGPLTPLHVFTEDDIVVGTYRLTYVPLEERKPFCAVMLWRSQPTNDVGLVKTTEVRYTGVAVNGPFEQYDLSDFCVTEAHATKIGKYLLARRKHTTHTLAFNAFPSAVTSALNPGDLVRVDLTRSASSGGVDTTSAVFYQIDEIEEDLDGTLAFKLTHFPTDENDASVIALDMGGSNSGGQAGPTTIGNVTITSSVVTPLGAPTALSFTRAGTSVTLNWTAPAGIGSASITDYVIQYSVAGAAAWSTFSDGVNATTTATITGLSASTEYDFRVAAVTSNGQGPWSDVVSTLSSYTLWIEPVWSTNIFLFPQT